MVSTIIPGMRKPVHVKTNIAASDAGPLNTGIMKQLEKHPETGNLRNGHSDQSLIGERRK
ncbi:MAG: hypothetical protein NTY95_13840 [Bacteroidia bacterium]|jgi:aryl-alcohol dehydrogenase-like predicted oxidoreductase|nr:hypothetical protein [Bacteroidia bacterium]